MDETSGDSALHFNDGVAIKRSKSHDDKEDRVSALPDAMIHRILSLLPSTLDAIATGFLSKRWRNQWTHLPVLVFKPDPYSGDTDRDDYLSFVENALALHACPKLKKFYLEYHSSWDPDPQFSQKIRFAVGKFVEELVLICHNYVEPYRLPEFLLDNACLVELEIDNCSFMPQWRVRWPALKSLKMARFSDSKMIESVVSGSPVLESLEVVDLYGAGEDDDVVVVSTSLKVLSFLDLDDDFLGAVKISCPNLVELSVYGYFPTRMIENALAGSPFIHSLVIDAEYVRFSLEKLVIASSSLKVLSVQSIKNTKIEVSCPNLEILNYKLGKGNVFKTVNLPASICATLDSEYREGSIQVTQLLKQFRHVDKLTIGRLFSKIVSDLDVEVCRSLPKLNIKCVTLKVSFYFGLALPTIAHALRSPTLETLVIELDSWLHRDRTEKDIQDKIISRVDDWNSIRSAGFTCLRSHLKTVRIIGLSEKDDRCKLVFDFIKFLLLNARKLEKMVLVSEVAKTDFVAEVNQKLLSFPRYSQSAKVEFLCSRTILSLKA